MHLTAIGLRIWSYTGTLVARLEGPSKRLLRSAVISLVRRWGLLVKFVKHPGIDCDLLLINIGSLGEIYVCSSYGLFMPIDAIVFNCDV